MKTNGPYTKRNNLKHHDMETIIIDRICTSCGCDKDTAREYLDAEVRNLRELRDANDLREGDLESAYDNLGIEQDFLPFFCESLIY